MGHLIGYARVSTLDQTLDMQLDDLNAAGCDRIFIDEGVSGSKASRPEWDKCLDHLREGDTLIIWKLDRAGRSLKHLIEVSERLEKMGVGFRSIQDAIDTSTPAGRFFFHVMGAAAQFERDLIKERTHAGLAAAKARGRNGGRPRSLSKAQMKTAIALSKTDMPVKEICDQLNCSRSVYYRAIRS